jgi:hypothetical protein
MPRAAKKTSCDPGRLFEAFAVDAAIGFHLVILDRSQVIALGLICGKIPKNPADLIRRKFSIDARCWRGRQTGSASTNQKP